MGKHLPVTLLKKIKKHRFVLDQIAKAKTSERKKILSTAPNQLFTIFKHLCRYAGSGVISLGKAKRYQKVAKKFAKSKSSSIKALVKQQGGIIGSIIAGALPFLSPLISKIFK